VERYPIAALPEAILARPNSHQAIEAAAQRAALSVLARRATRTSLHLLSSVNHDGLRFAALGQLPFGRWAFAFPQPAARGSSSFTFISRIDRGDVLTLRCRRIVDVY